MKTQHTQGKWAQDERGILADNQRIVWLPTTDENSEFVQYGIEQEEIDANARLIAAAPELLESLENIFALVKGECPSLLNEDSVRLGKMSKR